MLACSCSLLVCFPAAFFRFQSAGSCDHITLALELGKEIFLGQRKAKTEAEWPRNQRHGKTICSCEILHDE